MDIKKGGNIMQFVRTEDLKPGMRLAKPIYNKTGVLLYERDTKLTQQGINSIENFHLIGIFILEPAEPLPPLSKEDLEFEQYQTIYMFKLRENIKQIQEHTSPASLRELTEDIILRYGNMNHKLNFTQNLRSSADFIFKHAISTAILCAMISHKMHFSHPEQSILIQAALLYDLGYLTVPASILDKGDKLTEEERETVQLHLEKGYSLLRPEYNEYNLPEASLELIQRFIFNSRGKASDESSSLSPICQKLLPVLNVAVTFDKLTAMNLNQTPLSEIAAMRRLSILPDIYPANVVHALAECIHILPTGCCIDLSNGGKALVLEENPADFSRPLVLDFATNKVLDLSDDKIYEEFHVKDTMKTMDNRIQMDEETLKQFSADEKIRQLAEKFHLAKRESAARRAKQILS